MQSRTEDVRVARCDAAFAGQADPPRAIPLLPVYCVLNRFGDFLSVCLEEHVIHILNVVLSLFRSATTRLLTNLVNAHRYVPVLRLKSLSACARNLVFCTLPLAVMPMASKSSTIRR